MTDTRTDAKVQFGEPMGFIGVPWRNMGERLLTEEEMINGSRTPRSTPAWVMGMTAPHS